MNSLSALIFALLQLVLWPVIFYLFISWFISYLFPKAKWHKQFLRKGLRLILIGPFKKCYQAARWLVISTHTTRPEYNLQRFYLENYPATPLAFFAAVEEVMAQRQIIGVVISRITRIEWHLLSARRTYLLIRFRDAVCFLGGVPLGTSFLVSWRYTAMPGKILLILFQVPFIGVIAEKLFRPPTFYRADIYHALEQAIRAAVLEAANLLTVQGMRPLAETEQRPLLREFYGN